MVTAAGQKPITLSGWFLQSRGGVVRMSPGIRNEMSMVSPHFMRNSQNLELTTQNYREAGRMVSAHFPGMASLPRRGSGICRGGTCPARSAGGTRGRGERRWACDNRMAGTQPRAPTRRVHLHVGIGPTACGRNATPHTIERNPPSAFKAACGLSAGNVGADLCVRPLGGASAVAATTNELSMVSPHFARSECRGRLPRLPAEGWR